MRIAIAFATMLACALSGAAADIEGFLVDKVCSAKAIKDGYQKAGAHVKDCALMDGCVTSGFGVLTADNKYILFDPAGAKKAIAALEASKKSDNFKVKVSGDLKGNTIKVASIQIL
jgi:hypothetical protein